MEGLIKRHLDLFLGVVLTILIIPNFFTLLRPGFFPMQDDLQAFRIHQMDRCFKDFQIPCRWVPDPGYQYGYPQFNYYPPSVYYLGEVIHLLGFQFIDAVKILFILGFVLSTVAMFLLQTQIFGRWPAMVGALLYAYVPYKAVEVYVRGAMSEFWSLVLFPLIVWAGYLYIKNQRVRFLGLLALFVGLLLLTHNLMSLIFLPVSFLLFLVWLLQDRNPKRLIMIFFGYLLGLGLAATFTLPVLVEKPYAHLESLLGGYFDYRQHFVDVKRLFLSNHWGYGSSGLNQDNDLSLSVGIIQWIVGLVALVLALVNYRKHRDMAVFTIIVFGVGLLITFMIHQKSSFIWEQLPFLVYLQFPWRFLAVSIFMLSILAGSAVFFLEKINQKIAYTFGGVAILIAVLLYGSFFTPKEWLNISDEDKFSGRYWEKQLTISIFDYLPIYAKFPPIQKAPELPEILSGGVKFSEYKKGSNYQYGRFEASMASRIRLPLFDFPGMKVEVNSKKVEHIHDDCRGQEFCLGLITVDIPKGEGTIFTKLYDTPVRTAGNLLSFFSIGVIAYLLIKKNDRKS